MGTCQREEVEYRTGLADTGPPRWLSGKEPAYQAGDTGSIPRFGRSPGGINGNPLLPGESQAQGSLVGCHLWGRTESDTTEVT